MSDEYDGDDGEDDRLSLVSPIGYSRSTCGYCTPAGSGQRSPRKSSKSYGIWSYHLSPATYQRMLDHGWRRSGRYIYRPDCGNDGTCCAQLAIRLDVAKFHPTRKVKKAFASMQRVVRTPASASTAAGPSNGTNTATLTSTCKKKGKYAHEWDIEAEWRLIEWTDETDELARALSSTIDAEQRKLLALYHDARNRQAQLHRKGKAPAVQPPLPPRQRRLEAALCIASSTDEKYALFRKYQSRVHGEAEDKISSLQGFERFLCETPFMPTIPGGAQQQQLRHHLPKGTRIDIDSRDPIPFDLYHMEWRLDGVLVAVGVLDVLPRCISSVYLIYDPDLSDLQLGKVSALREIALVKQMQRKRGMEGITYYSMGLYVHTCSKMRYKAQYGPAELLDPKTNRFARYDVIEEQLDRGVRFGFSDGTGRPPPSSSVVQQQADEDEGDASSDDDDDDEGKALPKPPPPGMVSRSELRPSDLRPCMLLSDGKVDLVVNALPRLPPQEARRVLDCIAAAGPIAKWLCQVL